MTVGYGDISPQNEIEVMIVIIVQIMGTCTFGFVINEIGYTVSVWRKGRQVLERDLLTLEKMKRVYKLEDELMEKSRNFIISQNDQMVDQLLPEEENALMMKFNEDLRKSTLP